MGALIDSSVLIQFEREGSAASAALDSQEEFFVSVITAGELLHGVHRAADSGVRARRAAWVNALLEVVPLLDIDLSTARVHADLWAGLAAQGSLIGPHDLWLAATAVARGLRLITFNVREFDRVPGLEVDRWTPAT